MQTLSALELRSKESCHLSAPRPEKGTHFGVKVRPASITAKQLCWRQNVGSITV